MAIPLVPWLVQAISRRVYGVVTYVEHDIDDGTVVNNS